MYTVHVYNVVFISIVIRTSRTSTVHVGRLLDDYKSLLVASFPGSRPLCIFTHEYTQGARPWEQGYPVGISCLFSLFFGGGVFNRCSTNLLLLWLLLVKENQRLLRIDHR